jgi:hypothetical protein
VPAPTSYTDAALAAFMVTELHGVLSWTSGSDAVAEAVSDTAILLHSAIEDVTDMAALRAVARLSIWRMAESALVPSADWTVDNESLKKSQVWEHAKAMVRRYEDQCANLGIATAVGSGMVFIHPVTRSEDAYALPELAGAEF